MFGDYFTGATFAAKSWYDLKASLPKRLRCEQIGNGQRLNKLSRGTAAHSCVAALGDPLIVERWLFGIRINVARSCIARQHVSMTEER